MRPTHAILRRRAAGALAAGALALAAACAREEKRPPPRPPVPVAVATAVAGTVPITIVANGTVEPTQTVAIQPQTAGPVTAVRFGEGDEVRAGQVLFEIDPRPARAALAQAQAVLARDRATAAAARADAERYARLVAQGYVTQSQADQQRAVAEAIGATIAADQAALQTARLELSYTTIRAPISGKTGALNVRLGNQVRSPNPVPLVTINAVAPVLVRFPVPDRALHEVRAAQRAGRRSSGRERRDGGAPPSACEVDFIDNAKIDTNGQRSGSRYAQRGAGGFANADPPPLSARSVPAHDQRSGRRADGGARAGRRGASGAAAGRVRVFSRRAGQGTAAGGWSVDRTVSDVAVVVQGLGPQANPLVVVRQRSGVGRGSFSRGRRSRPRGRCRLPRERPTRCLGEAGRRSPPPPAAGGARRAGGGGPGGRAARDEEGWGVRRGGRGGRGQQRPAEATAINLGRPVHNHSGGLEMTHTLFQLTLLIAGYFSWPHAAGQRPAERGRLFPFPEP
jgi:multidrug efflux system membrane fusion protein